MACRGLRRLEIGGVRSKTALDVDGSLKLRESNADFLCPEKK